MSDPSALNALISATRTYQSTLVAKPTIKYPHVPAEPPQNTPSPSPDTDALAREIAPAVSRLIGRDIRERGAFP